VTPNYVTKDNRQDYKKALNKENQELSRKVLPTLPKPNRSTSQAKYKHSPKALNKHSIIIIIVSYAYQLNAIKNYSLSG
jgi:uncharacterized protein YgiM (DUF1202 family)